jgi:phosphoserine phosphatase
VDVYADIAAKELAISNVIVDRFKYDEQGTIIGVDKSNFSKDKAESIERIARIHEVPLEKIVAIGDTEFDIPMFEKAGLSIAINNGDNEYLKPIVDHYINCLSELKNIL